MVWATPAHPEKPWAVGHELRPGCLKVVAYTESKPLADALAKRLSDEPLIIVRTLVLAVHDPRPTRVANVSQNETARAAGALRHELSSTRQCAEGLFGAGAPWTWRGLSSIQYAKLHSQGQ